MDETPLSTENLQDFETILGWYIPFPLYISLLYVSVKRGKKIMLNTNEHP